MIKNPVSIENESFNIIHELIGKLNIAEPEYSVISRVIHATADVEFAENIIFNKDAVLSGIAAVRDGAEIITDVNMIRVAINKKICSRYGITVKCLIDEPSVAAQAEELKITRASCAIKAGVTSNSNCIVVIGNAPSALYELIKLITIDHLYPRLIIAMPIGFVGAEESKDELLRLKDIPFITNKGRKGGSPAASAAMNAILRLADKY